MYNVVQLITLPFTAGDRKKYERIKTFVNCIWQDHLQETKESNIFLDRIQGSNLDVKSSDLFLYNSITSNKQRI